jgi:hypothetical protein
VNVAYDDYHDNGDGSPQRWMIHAFYHEFVILNL